MGYVIKLATCKTKKIRRAERTKWVLEVGEDPQLSSCPTRCSQRLLHVVLHVIVGRHNLVGRVEVAELVQTNFATRVGRRSRASPPLLDCPTARLAVGRFYILALANTVPILICCVVAVLANTVPILICCVRGCRKSTA